MSMGNEVLASLIAFWIANHGNRNQIWFLA